MNRESKPSHGAAPDDVGNQRPSEFWEQRYGSSDQIWSGRPNPSLVHALKHVEPGSAVDLGCGEGADVLWLAEQGWEAMGVDISTTAVERARRAAQHAGLDDRASFEAADLTDWEPPHEVDLVTASFFQSPVELDRIGALQRAAAMVRRGGRLCIVSHASAPPWIEDAHDHQFPSPEDDLRDLALGDAWDVELQDVLKRDGVDPEGRPAVMDDSILLLHRVA